MAASDKKPSIYSNRDNLIVYSQIAPTPSDTAYQPFKGFYVKVSGAVSYMDWDGNLVVCGTLPAGQYWFSGQRILASATATMLIQQ